jgi:hypothetical protein
MDAPYQHKVFPSHENDTGAPSSSLNEDAGKHVVGKYVVAQSVEGPSQHPR